MAFLFHDIVLDDTAFTSASQEMAVLKQDAANLKSKLEKMYQPHWILQQARKFRLLQKMCYYSQLKI